MAEKLGSCPFPDVPPNSKDFCLGIFKPDAIKLGIIPDIETSIAASGLTIVRRKIVPVSPSDVTEVLWQNELFGSHIDLVREYMTERDVEVFGVEGENASERMRDIKRHFRRLYPDPNPVVSVLHSTEHDVELRRCNDHFFGTPEQ